MSLQEFQSHFAWAVGATEATQLGVLQLDSLHLVELFLWLSDLNGDLSPEVLSSETTIADILFWAAG